MSGENKHCKFSANFVSIIKSLAWNVTSYGCFKKTISSSLSLGHLTHWNKGRTIMVPQCSDLQVICRLYTNDTSGDGWKQPKVRPYIRYKGSSPHYLEVTAT